MRQITRTAAPVILAGLLIFGMVLAVSAQTRDVVGTLIAKVLTVQNAATFNGPVTLADDTTVPSGGSLTIASGATLTTNGYVASTVSSLTVNGNATVTGTTETASLNVTGNGDVTGNFEVTDHLLTQAEFYMIPPATLTVTDGGTINPTGAVVELTAAGAVGAQMDAASDGEFVILINTVNQTITITDTGSAKLAGDVSLGQYDTLTLIGQGVLWHEVSRSNN